MNIRYKVWLLVFNMTNSNYKFQITLSNVPNGPYDAYGLLYLLSIKSGNMI